MAERGLEPFSSGSGGGGLLWVLEEASVGGQEGNEKWIAVEPLGMYGCKTVSLDPSHSLFSDGTQRMVFWSFMNEAVSEK